MGAIRSEALPLVRWGLFGAKFVPSCVLIAGAVLLPFRLADWGLQMAVPTAPMDSSIATRIALLLDSLGFATPEVRQGLAPFAGILLDWRWMVGFGFAIASRGMFGDYEWADAARTRRLTGTQLAAAMMAVLVAGAISLHIWDVLFATLQAMATDIPDPWTYLFASPHTGEWLLDAERDGPFWTVLMGELFAQVPAFLIPVLVFSIAHNTMAAPRHALAGVAAFLVIALTTTAAESVPLTDGIPKAPMLLALLAVELAVISRLYSVGLDRRLYWR